MTDRVKAHGVHYTPPELARFLARVTLANIPPGTEGLSVLDPACGDGALLAAVAENLPNSLHGRTSLTGYETDPHAVERARCRLGAAAVGSVELRALDFLAQSVEGSGRTMFDVVIANPPYVRTQVLGARHARQLARQFNLTGRVDLYQAFTLAMAAALKPGGVLGLLASNRFLTVKAGQTLRRFLLSEFELRGIYDLGDTRLFRAAVLPVIVIAVKRGGSRHRSGCAFLRAYAAMSSDVEPQQHNHILSAIEQPDLRGDVRTPQGTFRIERGTLAAPDDQGGIWRLSTPESDRWLHRIRSRQAAVIGDVAHVRVGIKTTADLVFVRDDWDTLPEDRRPEAELLRPLLTHQESARWRLRAIPSRRVLYPHAMHNGKRIPIDLDEFPRARAYLESHADRLRSRRYLTDSGRNWYELWVPHRPEDWTRPKIVFPDISELPQCFLDESGAIVQGDCYWITLRKGHDPAWLPLILAVANGAFITRFYDAAFHNKLYAGRRRFMTQYVNLFPLPAVESRGGREIVRLTQALLVGAAGTSELEMELNRQIESALGID